MWINIKLRFSTPILKRTPYPDHFYRFDLAKINTPNILVHHDSLAKHLTYLSEYVNYPTVLKVKEAFDVSVTKELNFVFRKDLLEKNHALIGEHFREVLRKITEECELLRQDNLARGGVIENAAVWVWWVAPEGEAKEGKWNYGSTQAILSQAYQSNHPDEYWGRHQYVSDVVAGSQRYPWMPADISQVEGFLD